MCKKFISIHTAFVIGSLLLLPSCGMMPSNLGDSESARATTDQAIPPELSQRFQTALEAMKAKQYAKAIPLFEALAKEYPTFSGALTNIALAQMHRKKLAQAITAIDKAIAVNKKNYRAYTIRGQILRQQGKFKAAKIAYQEALKLNANYAIAHLNAGILLDMYLQEPKQALTHFRRYQAINGKEDKKVKGWIVELERRVKQ